MVELKKVERVFQSGGSEVKAVSGVTLKINEGTFAAIVGKSGSGKSTLLGLLGALDRPSSGEIIVDGKHVESLSDGELIRYRRSTIGYVFQSYNLVPDLTAIENVMLPMEFSGIDKSKRRNRAAELLNQVGINGDKQQPRPNRLSGGEQQRVSIARALANSPKIILADEPTGNLDSNNGKLIFDLLHGLSRNQGKTIIVVTHDLSIAGKTDKVFTLSDGHIAKD